MPTDGSSYFESAAPAGSIPTTRAAVMARKKREAEEAARRAPPMTPMAQEEMADADLMQQVPRERIDRQYNRLLRGADAGPLSQTSRAIKNAEYEQGAALRDMANRATVMRNRQSRDISSRDLQWQAAQKAQDFQRAQDEREFGMKEKEFEYRKTQDQRATEQAEKANRAAIYMRMAQSQDPYVRAQGEEALRGMYENPTGAPQAPPQQADPNDLLAQQPAETPYQARIRSIREKEAQDKADREAEREFKRREQDVRLKTAETGLERGAEDRARAIQEQERARKIAAAQALIQSGDPQAAARGMEIIAQEGGIPGMDFGNIATRQARRGAAKDVASDPLVSTTIENVIPSILEQIQPDSSWNPFDSDSLKPGAEQAIQDAIGQIVQAAEEGGFDGSVIAPLIEARVMKGIDATQFPESVKQIRAIIRKALGAGQSLGPFPSLASNRQPGGGPAF